MDNTSKKYLLMKIGGILLVLYVLIGGLFLPLKTGITGVNTFKIKSNTVQDISFDVYNPGENFKASKVLLKKENQIYESNDIHSVEQGLLKGKIEVKLGDSTPSALYDVFVLGGNGKQEFWMYFPDAIWVDKDLSDTLLSNRISSKSLAKEFAGNGKKSGAGLKSQDVQMGFPNRPILNESIRNLLYHVPMWFAMMFLMFMSVIFAIKYLSKQNLTDDLWSESFIKVGILTGILGCVTGSSWASITWQSWWPVDDPKLNGVAIGMFMYLAYLILRNTLKDPYQKARISSVYAVLIFPIFMALIAIMPKLSEDSLHPGSGGTVGFNKYDLDNTLRLFFYPAVIGWILIFSWITVLRFRYETLKNKIQESEDNE
jgi:heme exporter protein C